MYMRFACYHALSMGVFVQDPRGARGCARGFEGQGRPAGVSLSEYARGVLARSAARPTPAELSARVDLRGAATLSEPSELAVRRLRDLGE